MSNYRRIKWNDITNGEGVCVSFWFQGCPIHCKGCHNQDLWSFDKGKPVTLETINNIKEGLIKNGVKRNFSILGGEPLCEANIDTTINLIATLISNKEPHEHIPKIYLWTGYNIMEDNGEYFNREIIDKIELSKLHYIINHVDMIIYGPYEEDKRDIRLRFGGSTNQKIFDCKIKRTLDIY